MAAIAAVTIASSSLSSFAAISSFHHTSSSFLLNPSSRLRSLQRSLPFIRASTTEFNISFGTERHEEKTSSPAQSSSNSPSPMLIPWIIRGEDGKLQLSTTPPAPFLHAMAEAKNSPAKKDKKGKKEDKIKKKAVPVASVASPSPSSVPPKYSKAARRFYNQQFREPQRLSKVLASVGVASRRSSEELIFEGRVTVNGTVCKTPQTRVDLLKDAIYVNGNRLSKKLPPKLYFAVNKPKGYICSNGDESKSVISLFDEYWTSWNKTNPGLPKPLLFTVGRLDVATTGLIIVTNDGDIAQKLAHPSSKLSKEYIATIDGVVHRRHLIAISEGVQIDGVHCAPDSVELLPVQPDASRARLRIVVHQGRNHEVRELVKNAGLKIHSLKRIRIGGFRLPSDLGLGKYVELKEAQLKLLGGKV